MYQYIPIRGWLMLKFAGKIVSFNKDNKKTSANTSKIYCIYIVLNNTLSLSFLWLKDKPVSRGFIDLNAR